MSGDDQVLLTAELLGVLRRAVDYAIAADAQLVAPAHLLLALLDDADIGEVLGAVLSREALEASLEPVLEPAASPEVAEAETTPTSATEPTLIFRSVDGNAARGLDRTSYRLFVEGARRAEEDGNYLPKHVVIGYVAEAAKEETLLRLLGPDPHAVTKAVYALSR